MKNGGGKICSMEVCERRDGKVAVEVCERRRDFLADGKKHDGAGEVQWRSAIALTRELVHHDIAPWVGATTALYSLNICFSFLYLFLSVSAVQKWNV